MAAAPARQRFHPFELLGFEIKERLKMGLELAVA